MNHTYETLRLKFERLLKKKKSANERFQLNEIRYNEAKAVFQKEKADVEKLEAQSLTTFLRTVIGTQDKKLYEEKQEQIKAKLNLDETSALYLESRDELSRIVKEIDQLKAELDTLKEKLKVTDPDFQEDLSRKEEQQLQLESDIQEISEALNAGQSVLSGLKSTLEKLDSADSLATWDMFTDSFLIDMFKYDKIDQAEEELFYLEGLIERYKKELKDVDLQNVLDYENLSQMRRVFDVFFDNIFSDWSTKDTIQRNKANLDTLYIEVERIQKHLQDSKVTLVKQLEELQLYY
ncbi:coiled-coil domain-containing protein [Alkalibacterium sp. f15]|uniref:coiled-coil domain-containing protein n=1 Tax=Alkalibacterium sp. f15 TaxID=3414029 RepID=UPI003BF7EE8C